MPVSKKRKDIKHLSGTGRCKTIKGKQVQNKCFHIPNKLFDFRTMARMFPNMKAQIAAVLHARQLKKQRTFALNYSSNEKSS